MPQAQTQPIQLPHVDGNTDGKPSIIAFSWMKMQKIAQMEILAVQHSWSYKSLLLCWVKWGADWWQNPQEDGTGAFKLSFIIHTTYLWYLSTYIHTYISVCIFTCPHIVIEEIYNIFLHSGMNRKFLFQRIFTEGSNWNHSEILL